MLTRGEASTQILSLQLYYVFKGRCASRPILLRDW